MIYNEREHASEREQHEYVLELYKRLDEIGESHWHVCQFNYQGADGKYHRTTHTTIDC